MEECSGDYYELFDYLRKVKIDSRQIRDHGRWAAFDLNSRCGAIVKRGGKAYLDELAMDYNFEGSNELMEHLSEYKTKKKWARELAEQYLDEYDEEC